MTSHSPAAPQTAINREAIHDIPASVSLGQVTTEYRLGNLGQVALRRSPLPALLQQLFLYPATPPEAECLDERVGCWDEREGVVLKPHDPALDVGGIE